MTKWLKLLLHGIAAAMLIAIVLLVFLNVVLRYFFHIGLGWTEEAARFLLIGMTFVAAAAAVKEWGHFRLLVATKWMPAKALKWVQMFSILAVIAMSAILVRYGIAIAQVSWQQTSPELQWQMGYIYTVVPVTGAIMLVFALEHLWNAIHGRDLPTPTAHDPHAAHPTTPTDSAEGAI